MITLIIGTPNSGKSALAEKIAVESFTEGKKYYIATMIPYGKEGQERIKKHQSMRQGKGFETLEWPSDFAKRKEDVDFVGCTVLIECMSNLIGNEMHEVKNAKLSKLMLCNQIVEEVNSICEEAFNTIIVTNEFPEDDDGYDEDTRDYVRLVSMVNTNLRSFADTVYIYTDGEWIRNENN